MGRCSGGGGVRARVDGKARLGGKGPAPQFVQSFVKCGRICSCLEVSVVAQRGMLDPLPLGLVKLISWLIEVVGSNLLHRSCNYVGPCV